MYQTAKGYEVYREFFFFFFFPPKPTNYILIQKRLNSHLQFLNLDADMKRAKSDNSDKNGHRCLQTQA